jgi:hypothetical protein
MTLVGLLAALGVSGSAFLESYVLYMCVSYIRNLLARRLTTVPPAGSWSSRMPATFGTV